jgi:hypothetical protein
MLPLMSCAAEIQGQVSCDELINVCDGCYSALFYVPFTAGNKIGGGAAYL